MSPKELIDRFLARISAHPETATLGLALMPYRALASGGDEDLVKTLDQLASMWQETKRE